MWVESALVAGDQILDPAELESWRLTIGVIPETAPRMLLAHVQLEEDRSGVASYQSLTVLAIDGDTTARAGTLDLLHPLFERIGGRCFAIAPEQKTLYHTGAVLACNNLTSLIEAALRCMEAAGVARQIAWPALKPLIEGTLGNIERLGTRTALTGPIARGDAGIVDAQNRALETLDPQLASLYRALGAVALNLAGEGMAPAKRAEVAKALEPPASPARSAG